MSHYEIEIKTLLGSKENADKLKENMCKLDSNTACTSTNKQLNHYFKDGDVKALYEKTRSLFNEDQLSKFTTMIEKGSSFSVRTRQRDEEVLLVVKASLDAGTSENTVTRLEVEETVSISLDELDALVLDSGFDYQAKWSREREEFEYKGITVCLDRNAGYGYLAEFEKVIDDEEQLESVRAELVQLMEELEVEELAQDQLERMFEHYNSNWPEYYGTDKTFVIE